MMTSITICVIAYNITRFNVAKVEGYFFLFIYQTTFPYSLHLLEAFNVITYTSFYPLFRSGTGPRGCVLISVL
jgi:hypothetical protein